jgi:ubiquinone/menaquinone biosynthesis C-methylase UbiE
MPIVASRLYKATWGRGFAAIYDRFLHSTEEAGLAEDREQLLARATGATLELGAGTGLNLEHYPKTLSRLVLTEPEDHMAKRLRQRAFELRPEAEVIEAPAEHLPVPDSSFDTVVSTLVLCTVPNQAASLSEVARVLKPGGRLLFLEHVRSDDERIARWQDRLHRPWRFLGAGCNCNRDTEASIRRHLEIEGVQHAEMPKAPSFVRPMILGSARAPS